VGFLFIDMTKQELIELIKECIEETQLEEGISLYYRGDVNTAPDEMYYKSDYTPDETGYLKLMKDFRSIKVNVDFSKTRLDDLIIFDKNPVRAGVRAGIEINFYAPYRFKTINEINDDFKMSNSQISNEFFDRKNKIGDLKTMLRRAIKNLKSTEDVILTSQNIEDIKQLVKNGVSKFNEEHARFSEFDIIIKVPSAAPLNDLIIEEIKKYTDSSKTKIVTDLIFKKQVKDINIDFQKWKSERYDNIESQHGKLVNVSNFFALKRNLKQIKDDDFQIKSIYPSELRRYVSEFLKFNPHIDRNIFKAIYGGKILIVDDTVGAYKTIRDASELISRAKPKYIYSFALLSDWFKQ